ncbi:hypothetical protein ILYODFUR_009833 [Ilyodon furcidens]|uniref:Uncharacterized protein n=1 Tax=Ilyodon furcidens TaxID=33524 RepID=A0ABV0V1S2_9TELE
MNQDPSHLLLHWTKSTGSLLTPSFFGQPPANPVHPPPSTVPTPTNSGSTDIRAFLYSPSSVTWVHFLLVSPTPSGGSLLQHICIPVPVSCIY